VSSEAERDTTDIKMIGQRISLRGTYVYHEVE